MPPQNKTIQDVYKQFELDRLYAGKSSGDGSQPVTDEIDGGKDTGEGKKPGHAKNAGKPGSQAV